MSNVTKFPGERRQGLGMAATVESDLDEANPHTDCLRNLLRERRRLIDLYGPADGSVHEINGSIAERLAALAGEP